MFPMQLSNIWKREREGEKKRRELNNVIFAFFSRVIPAVFVNADHHPRQSQWPPYPCVSPSRRKTPRRWCNSTRAHPFTTLAVLSERNSLKRVTWANVSSSCIWNIFNDVLLLTNTRICIFSPFSSLLLSTLRALIRILNRQHIRTYIIHLRNWSKQDYYWVGN